MIDSEVSAKEFVRERCDDVSFAKLGRFVADLTAENDLQNLVSRGTLTAIWHRHIADSAQLLDHVPQETIPDSAPWLDLGSGAGPPGLVIATMRPEWRVVLVESRRKRVDWLQRAIADLELPNCTVEGSRLELVDDFEASVISARAFAPLPKLLDLSARFSTGGTIWVLPKGRSAAQELTDLPSRFGKMFHVEPSKTDSEAGIIVGQLKARQRGNGRKKA